MRFSATRPRTLSISNSRARLVLAALTCCLLTESTGCILISKHFVDRQTQGSYEAIQSTGAPRLVKVDVEFQRNGRRAWFLAPNIEPKVVRVLTATRAFAEADSTNEAYAGQLKVVVDEQSTLKERSAAFGKGFLAGFTYGVIAPEAVQRYEIRVAYTPPEGATQSWSYQSTRRCKFGLDALLTDQEPVPVSDVFDRIVEDSLVNFICDYQGQGRNTAVAMNTPSAAHGSSAMNAVFSSPPAGLVPASATDEQSASNAAYSGLKF